MNHIWATIVLQKSSEKLFATHFKESRWLRPFSAVGNKTFLSKFLGKFSVLHSNTLTMKFLLALVLMLMLHVSLSAHAASGAGLAVDDDVITSEDVSIAIDILANDAPLSNLDLNSLEVVLNPSYGSYLIEQSQSDEIEIIYQPYANFWGDDLFEYKICDVSGSTCETAVVTIHIGATNDELIAVDDHAVATADLPVQIDVLANDLDYDFDMDPSTLSVVTPTVRGTIEVVEQHFVYTSDESGGIDRFTYQICDLPLQSTSAASCSIATVQIVTGDVQEITTSAKPNGATSISVSDRPEDRTSQTEIQVVDNPSNGSVLINSDGTFSYQPNSGFIGTDAVMIEACPAPNLCSVIQYTINVETLQLLLPFINL